MLLSSHCSLNESLPASQERDPSFLQWILQSAHPCVRTVNTHWAPRRSPLCWACNGNQPRGPRGDSDFLLGILTQWKYDNDASGDYTKRLKGALYKRGPGSRDVILQRLSNREQNHKSLPGMPLSRDLA